MFARLITKTSRVFSNPHVKEGIKSFTIGFVSGYAGHKTGNKVAEQKNNDNQHLNDSNNIPKPRK